MQRLASPQRPCQLGILIALPSPWSTQVREIRQSVGDTPGDVPTHITILPPTEIDPAQCARIDEHIRRVAAQTAPINVALGAPTSFRPVTDVAYVSVSAGRDELDQLQRRVRAETGPLVVDLNYPYTPHVTLAHGVSDAALDRALQLAADLRGEFVATAMSVYDRVGDEPWHCRMVVPLGADLSAHPLSSADHLTPGDHS